MENIFPDNQSMVKLSGLLRPEIKAWNQCAKKFPNNQSMAKLSGLLRPEIKARNQCAIYILSPNLLDYSILYWTYLII